MESPVATAWAIWTAGGRGDADGGGRTPSGPPRSRPLGVDERDLFLLQRGVELLYLRRREIPLLQEVGDLLRTEKTLTSPPTQKLVRTLRQHHGVLGRH